MTWFVLGGLVVATVFMSSCATCDSGPGLYIRGTMKTQISSHGTFVRTGKAPQKEHLLARPGDSFDIAEGIPFQLTIPEVVNLGTNALQISEKDTTTAGPNIYTVALVESCTPYVIMDKQCKIVNWYNPYRIPEVRIRNYDDQLVMTPLLDHEDAIIGYEIRLGDHKECGSPALDRLKKRRGAVFAPVKSNTEENPWELTSLEGAKPD